jgi:hypothetical protein
MRTSAEVLRRAIVMTSVAFRASLEATTHPRSYEISQRLLPWLETLGMASDIDPIEHDLLATALGKLHASQKTDANWSGEGAVVMCWALHLTAQPPHNEFVDYTSLFDKLGILRGNPQMAFPDITLRSLNEISDFHIQVETMRTALQLTRADASIHTTLRNVWLSRLSEIGLQGREDDLDEAVQRVSAYSTEERQGAAGLCFVRSVATSWLVDGRRAYFENEENTPR